MNALMKIKDVRTFYDLVIILSSHKFCIRLKALQEHEMYKKKTLILEA